MTFSWVLDESKYLKSEEVKKLRETCRKLREKGVRTKNFVLVRDWFMVELGLFTGLRVEEMTNLNCGDLFLENTESSLIVRRGKGDKKRVVMLNTEFKKECLWFLNYKKRIGQTIEDNAPLLSTSKGKRVSKRTLQKAFKRCLHKAGLPNHYSIHCLRHTYGSHLYKVSNHNLRLVQKQLGHASIRTTEVYADLLNEDVKEAIEKLYEQ